MELSLTHLPATLIASSAPRFPQGVESYLSNGHARTLAFNRRGTLLAAGRVDGQCTVWDFDTRSVARDLEGHVAEVRSVRYGGGCEPAKGNLAQAAKLGPSLLNARRARSWSRSGRRLVTGGLDGRCILWDLVLHDGTDPPGARIEVPFTSPVLQVVMHPRRKYACHGLGIIVSADAASRLHAPPPASVVRRGRRDFVTCTEHQPPEYVSIRLPAEPGDEPVIHRRSFAYAAPATEGDGAAPAAPLPVPPCGVCFDTLGERLYIVDKAGNLFICDVKSKTVRRLRLRKPWQGGRAPLTWDGMRDGARRGSDPAVPARAAQLAAAHHSLQRRPQERATVRRRGCLGRRRGSTALIVPSARARAPMPAQEPADHGQGPAPGVPPGRERAAGAGARVSGRGEPLRLAAGRVFLRRRARRRRYGSAGPRLGCQRRVPAPTRRALLGRGRARGWPGCGEQQKHSIYIWDRHLHHLIKILEGPKDALVDLIVRRVPRRVEDGCCRAAHRRRVYEPRPAPPSSRLHTFGSGTRCGR